MVVQSSPPELIYKVNEHARIELQPAAPVDAAPPWQRDLERFADDIGIELGARTKGIDTEIAALRSEVNTLRQIVLGSVTPLKGSRDAA
jgi:hypothetical protein